MVKWITICAGVLVVPLLLFQPAAQGAEVWKIGLITATTGKYAPLGTGNLNAIMLAEELVNQEGGIKGKKVKVIFQDDEGDPAKSAALAKKLVAEEKVIGVIGPTSVVSTFPVMEEAKKAGIPHIYVHPVKRFWKDPKEGSKYSFHTVPGNDLDAEAVADYLIKKLKVKKVGILHDANEYGTEGAKLLTEELKKLKGPEVVATEKYQEGDRDLTAVLTKIRNREAEALVVWGTLPTPAIIAKNMRQLGYNVPFVGSTGIASRKFLELAGDAANGVVFTSSLRYGGPLPEEKQFFDMYVKKYKTAPTIFAGFGWDAFFLLKRAIETAKSDDPNDIRDALENIKKFRGVVGEFNFSPTDHNGLSVDSIVFIRVKDGEWLPET